MWHAGASQAGASVCLHKRLRTFGENRSEPGGRINRRNRQMEPKQILCRHCGAVIPPGAARCSFCGSSYEPEAEREYMRTLEQVRSQLDEVGNVGEETSGKEIRRIRRRIFRILAVILIFAAAVYGLFLFLQKREDRKNREEYAWRKEALPALDRLYEEGDYEALLQAWQEAQDAGHSLYDWEHNAFCEYYESAFYVEEILRMREKGLFEETDAVLLLNDELRFRGLPYRNGIPAEDREAIRERIAPFENDLVEIFQAGGEDLRDFDNMLKKNGGYPEYNICKEYVSNHPEILMKPSD